ncbi:MAG TPA: RNA ligase family protein [Tepidisphaeraceae bacterium]
MKYPRTRHVQGSRLQPGDEDLEQVPLRELCGKYLVIEGKQDGANSGISFDAEGKLYMQSRGHFLTGGPREAQFTLFKQWAATRADLFHIALEDRYVADGEWLYKKHTVYYDALPHYWAEFDVFDKGRHVFLDTPSRRALLNGLPYAPVTVLWSGVWTREMRFEDFIGPSRFKTAPWRQSLRDDVESLGYDWDLVWRHTDPSDLMEGLYIKWEEDGIVRGRCKFVRHDFVSRIVSNDEHHDNLPPVPNRLAAGVDLFSESGGNGP